MHTMPRYRVRLQSPSSHHYRVTYVNAESTDEAYAIAEEIDKGLVADPAQPHDHRYERAYCIERGQPIPPLKEWGCIPPDPSGTETQAEEK